MEKEQKRMKINKDVQGKGDRRAKRTAMRRETPEPVKVEVKKTKKGK